MKNTKQWGSSVINLLGQKQLQKTKSIKGKGFQLCGFYIMNFKL